MFTWKNYVKNCFTKGGERKERKEKCEYDDLKRWFIDKNGGVMFTRRRIALQKKVEGFPVLYDKS